MCGSLKRGAQLGAIFPMSVRAVPNEGKCFIKESNNLSHVYSSDISQRKIQLLFYLHKINSDNKYKNKFSFK